jgi:FAD synthetase
MVNLRAMLTTTNNSLEEVSFSYNGGKDCLVLLILLLAGLSIHHSLPANMQNKNKTLPAKLPSVYIISSHPFAEVDEFVNSSSEHYHLSLSRYAMPMKQAFAKYLEDNKHIKAILVGTRRTDPHGGLLTHFDMTDGGWPRFMRVHPVIDWHYREIWGVCCLLFSLPSFSLARSWDYSHSCMAVLERQN